MNIVNDDLNVEKFLYKYIIESTIYLKDIWSQLIISVESERKSREKVFQLSKVLEKYKELYAIQMYLNSISLKSLFFDKKENIKKSDISSINNKIAMLMTQIDGAISRLEFILNERIENNNNNDIFSNVFIYYLYK